MNRPGSSSDPLPQAVPLRRRIRGKQPPPQAAQHPTTPEIKINNHTDSYYTKLIELYWHGGGLSPGQALDMNWFAALPRAHKHIVGLGQSGLPFQIKLKMVWLVDIPTKGEYNRLHAINMVPFRVVPGVCCRSMPSSLEGMSAIIRSNIKNKMEHYTQLESSGWVFKELKVLEIQTKLCNARLTPR